MLHERVRALGLGGRVIFAGEQTNPHPYFAAADILVFASQMEGFGTVVPEAMAHGRAVVVRRLPGVNDDFVLEGETGSLFDTAEEYVAAFGNLAKTNNSIIVPANLSDMSGLIASAMQIVKVQR